MLRPGEGGRETHVQADPKGTALTTPSTTSIKTVAEYFKIGDGSTQDDARNSLSAFAREWKALSDRDKDDIRSGIADGTYDYA